MSFPDFEGCEERISDSDLFTAEVRMGVILPSDLRRHYLKYNGGSPVPSCYPFEGDFYEVRQFFSIKYGDPESTLEGVYATVAHAIPDGLIPFSDDSAGNFYCYSVAKPTLHFVCYWNHELYKDHDRGIRVLSPSLQEFLDGFIRHPYLDQN